MRQKAQGSTKASNGRCGWIADLHQSRGERQGCADSGRSWTDVLGRKRSSANATPILSIDNLWWPVSITV
jgi:hypothetical protein